jgi:hypothetical protein
MGSTSLIERISIYFCGMKLTLLFAIAAAFVLQSCKKPIPGCTDPNAENYNISAEENDGTCSYRGGAVFYHDAQTAQNLLDAGVTGMKLFVDNQFFDINIPNVSFNFVPTCSHPDALKVENYGIGNNPSQSFSYRITDQDEVTLAAGIFSISGNDCTAIEWNY